MEQLSQNRVGSDETVDNRSASSIVANALREKILHGEIPAGERLRQDALATRFGVSDGGSSRQLQISGKFTF